VLRIKLWNFRQRTISVPIFRQMFGFGRCTRSYISSQNRLLLTSSPCSFMSPEHCLQYKILFARLIILFLFVGFNNIYSSHVALIFLKALLTNHHCFVKAFQFAIRNRSNKSGRSKARKDRWKCQFWEFELYVPNKTGCQGPQGVNCFRN